MQYPGFVGPSAPSQSSLLYERTVNWYVERSPNGLALLPTPGQRSFATVSETGSRGYFAVNGRAFAVIGTKFYEMFADFTMTVRATVLDDTFPATFSYNRQSDQLFVTSGGDGYTYNMSTHIVTTVLTNKATQGGVINGRFLAFHQPTGLVYLSALNDGLTWDSNLFFRRSIASDPWMTMLIGSREIWLIGESTGEVWYDSGAFPQPFAPIPGAFFKTGIVASFAGAIAGEMVTWVSHTEYGAGPIVAARGYTPQPISNAAVSTAISAYARLGAFTNTEVMIYEQEGHTFAAFSFPIGRGTWVVDLETGDWHERGSWDIDNSRYDAWRPRVHCHAFNKHLVGDRTTGQVSELDVTFGSEAGDRPIRRLRIAPPLFAAPGRRIRISQFAPIFDEGLGLVSGQGSDPKIMFRMSQNAKTWSAERTASAGRLGDYDHQACFNRCGSSLKVWQPEIVVTDPIPWRCIGAEIVGDGFATGQRAAA